MMSVAHIDFDLVFSCISLVLHSLSLENLPFFLGKKALTSPVVAIAPHPTTAWQLIWLRKLAPLPLEGCQQLVS